LGRYIKDPHYTAVGDSVKLRGHSAAGATHAERATESREGGRLHGRGVQLDNIKHQNVCLKRLWFQFQRLKLQ